VHQVWVRAYRGADPGFGESEGLAVVHRGDLERGPVAESVEALLPLSGERGDDACLHEGRERLPRRVRTFDLLERLDHLLLLLVVELALGSRVADIAQVAVP